MELNKTHLHPYQKYGCTHIIKNQASGLFLDMGLGKTVTTLSAIVELIECLEVSRVLVIAPKRVAESVWIQEAAKWVHTNKLSFSLIAGNEKQRKAALKESADIYLLGRDNVPWLCTHFGGTSLPFDMLVLDELSSFKNPKSQRFKALRRVRSSITRVVGLTGTPAPNGLTDLWAQLYLLDQGKRLGRTLGEYRADYFKPGAHSGGIVYNYKLQSDKSKDEIFDKIGDICVSMKAEDFLNMPDKVLINEPVKFTPDVEEVYKKFEREMVLELIHEIGGDPREITAANAAGLCNKLLQFSNGAVYDSDRGVNEVHDLKLDKLEDILEGANGKPLLVAVAFKHDASRIVKRFASIKPRILSGQQDLDDWNEGRVPMLILHPASGGHGLNIQHGSNYIVWFGLNWSLELYKQLNARLWRQGQKARRVFIYHLVSISTIDERVLKALQGKEDTENELLGAVKADSSMMGAVADLVKKYS